MDAYNEIYKTGTKFDKFKDHYGSPFFKGALIAMPDHRTSKARKDMLQMYFSKAAIARLEPLIMAHIAKLLNILRQAAQEQKSIDLNMGYRCLTSDIVMDYSYQTPLGALDSPNFHFPLIGF